jgi:hypothetical protein
LPSWTSFNTGATIGQGSIALADPPETVICMCTHPEGLIHQRIIDDAPMALALEPEAWFRGPDCSLLTQSKSNDNQDALYLASLLVDGCPSRRSSEPQAGFHEIFDSSRVARYLGDLVGVRGTIVASNAAARLERMVCEYEFLRPLQERRNKEARSAYLDERAIQELWSQIHASPPEIRSVLCRCLLIGLATGLSARESSQASIIISSKGELLVQQKERARPIVEHFVSQLLEVCEQDQIRQYIDFDRAQSWFLENVGVWPDELIRRRWLKEDFAALADLMARPPDER